MLRFKISELFSAKLRMLQQLCCFFELIIGSEFYNKEDFRIAYQIYGE